MDTFIEQAIKAFGGEAEVNIIEKDVNDQHFGSGQLKLIYKKLIIIITNDRGICFADIGSSESPKKLSPLDQIIKKLNPIPLLRPNPTSGEEIAVFIRKNYEAIKSTV